MPREAARVLAVALSATSVFMTGGLIFGLSSLYPVLYDNQIFALQCGTNTSACLPAGLLPGPCCAAQLSTLTAMSTVGFFLSDASMVCYGELNDRSGPRACFAVGTCFTLLGLVVAALAPSARAFSDTAWIVAFGLMGLGGPGCFLATLSFSERWRGIEPVISATARAPHGCGQRHMA